MKKTFIYLTIFSTLLLLTIYFVMHKSLVYRSMNLLNANTIKINSFEPVLAVFSFQSEVPGRIFESFPHFTVELTESYFWDFNKVQIDQILDTLPILVTVETWGGNTKSSYIYDPLKDFLNGRFDDKIKQLCTNLIGMRPNVYIRLNPEMEVPVKRYPWQRNGRYIEAFQHFAALCKTYAPQAKLVWGPAGYPGVMDNYPGDELVDAASISLKSESEMLLDVYPKNYPVAYDLMRRLHRLRFIDKPIFVIGTKQSENDSVTIQLISSISQQICENRKVIYSKNNFKRPEVKVLSSGKRKIEIGLYDPQSLLIEEEPVTMEHLFVDFGSLHDGSFEQKFEKVISRNHNVIVTFEPFRYPGKENDLNVLQHVSEGKYDKEISQLYSIIKGTETTVYLRYAHEMEIPVTRYPWQSQNPIDYINSFRYFMTFQDSLPPTIKRVWGPAGDRGSIEWWPGNDVVDFVSFAIYGLPDKNIIDPKRQESFSTIFYRKSRRLRFLDKPLLISEFGVKGSEEYQTMWLDDAAKVIRENPQIIGVCYFNMSDTPKAWGEISPPDWRISKKSFYHFLKDLNDE